MACSPASILSKEADGQCDEGGADGYGAWNGQELGTGHGNAREARGEEKDTTNGKSTGCAGGSGHPRPRLTDRAAAQIMQHEMENIKQLTKFCFAEANTAS